MKNLSDNLKHPIIEERDSSVNDEMLKIIEARNHLNNQSQKILKKTACDFCRLLPCWFEQKHVDKDFCDRFRLFDTSKRIANARALALYERELRQFKRLLNEVSSDKMGGKLISVGGSLAAFKKALEDDEL